MAAIYGAQFRPARHDAMAELPDPSEPAALRTFIISSVDHTVLKTGETVLVTSAEVAAEDGTALSSHADGGLLSVYILRQTEGKWTVIKRYESVATLGSSGQLGTIAWPMLGTGKPGLAIIGGGTWQGYSVTDLTLFALGEEQLRDVSGELISLHSDSEGGCDPEKTTHCWNIDGKWHFVAAQAAGAEFDDLVIEFSGEDSVLKEDGQRSSKKVTAKARYAFDGKRYRLVEGKNIVPSV